MQATVAVFTLVTSYRFDVKYLNKRGALSQRHRKRQLRTQKARLRSLLGMQNRP